MKKYILPLFVVAIFSSFNLIRAQFDVSPNSKFVGPSSGTTTFDVSSTVGWSVSDNASWLTATKTDGSTISVSYDANTSTSSRTASITAIGTEGVTETVTLTQGFPYVTLGSDSESVSATSGTLLIYVSANFEWSVSDDVSWLSATKTSGNTISASYTVNPNTSNRTATITVYGTGGVTASASMTVTQAAASPFLAVSPDSRDVNLSSGTATYYVSSNVGWSVSDDASWCTATKTDGGTISVSYDVNLTGAWRIAHITVTGTGGLGETVELAQDYGYVSFIYSDRVLSAASGTKDVEVSTNLLEWTVTDDASWLTVTKTDGSRILDISYDANPSTSPRSAFITVTGIGEITTSGTLRLDQDGALPYLDISPNSQTVSSLPATTIFNVNSNVGWSVSDDATWCTVTKTNATTISVSYDINGPESDRTAHITAIGTGGITETVTLTQNALVMLDVNPSSQSVSAASGTTSFTAYLTGPAGYSWDVSDDASWLSVTKSDWETISVSYEANISTSDRTAKITVEADGGESEHVWVYQAGVTFDISPDSRSVSAESGTTIFDMNSDVGWSISDDASWLSATKTDGSTISVSYDANTSTTPRTANITASGTGGLTETVTITQSAEAAYLEISPISRSITSASDSTTIIITSNIDWSVSENAEWLSATKSNDTLLTVYYDENASVEDRSAILTFSGEGVSSQTASINQKGTSLNAIIDLFDNNQITIYPNPSSNKIYLKSGSDINTRILISLYDGSGKLMYSSYVDRISSSEAIEIDISAFNTGVYILRLNNSKSLRIKKVIKQ